MKLRQNLENLLSPNQIGFIALVLFASLTLFLRYGNILNAGNHAVIQKDGDAFNAYKLVTFHAKYDSTYSHFGGNAYPYGDHVVLASVLPLISNSLQFFKKIGLDLTDYSVAILHASMIFSYLVCAIFLYLILIRFSLPPWYSIIIAIGITLLSPQNDRIFGHFGLAHAYAIPMTIYFLLLFDENPRWWVSFCLFLTVMFTAAIQFYFFALSAFLIGTFYFFTLLKKSIPVEGVSKKWRFPFKDVKVYAVHFFIQAILPYLIFTWWIAQFEVLDRPIKPFGYTHYISYWEGVFLSLRMPYFQWINEHIIPFRQIDFEGLAYVGLVSFVIVLVMLFTWIKYIFKRSFFNQLSKNTYQAGFLQKLFATSLVLLLFSFGLPFTLPKMAFLLDYTGPLQQFRSVGRFNWIFYYTINIIAFTYIYRKFGIRIDDTISLGTRKKITCQSDGFFFLLATLKLSNVATAMLENFALLKEKITSPFLVGYLLPRPLSSIFKKKHYPLFIFLSVFIYEVWQFNHSRPYPMHPLKELQEKDYFKKRLKIDFSQYQAILPLPYFNVGTDNFYAKIPIYMQQKSLLLTMETGLPSIASLSNRSSISRTYNLFQTVAESYQVPTIINDFPNKKPLLIIADTTFLNKYDHVIKSLKTLGTIERLRFFELPLGRYKKKIINRKETIQKALKTDKLFGFKNFSSTDSINNFTYKSFDDQPIRNKYKGTGGLKLDISSPKIIFKEQLPNAKSGEQYTLSFWCDLSQFPTALTFVYIKEYDSKTSRQLWRHFPQVRNYMPVMDNNGWVLFEFPFVLKKNGIIEVSLFNKEMKKQSFFVDELLIRKTKTTIYHSNGNLFKNNRWY